MGVKEIVINTVHGGFSLSDAGIRRYAELKGLKLYEAQAEFSGLRGRMADFYLVPFAEYEKAYNEDAAARMGWIKSNALCFSDRAIPRDDPALVQVVKEQHIQSNGRFAKLKVVEIPDDVEWEIEAYDGLEWVAEKHRVWE